jgi:hypothetical protein
MAGWLKARLHELGIPAKAVPADDVRRHIRERFEQRLLGHLWEGVSELLEVSRLLTDLDAQLGLTSALADRALDKELHRRLADRPAHGYTAVLDEVVTDFFKTFVEQHRDGLRERVRAHVRRVRQEEQP